MVETIHLVSHKGTNGKAILLIHGFTTTVANVLPAFNRFVELGYSVYAPKLLGHYGTTAAEFIAPSWKDWVKQCDTDLLALFNGYGKDNVYAAGFSMGGLIATILGVTHHLKKVILYAPAFYPTNWLIYLTPVVQWFVKYFKNKDYKSESKRDTLYFGHIWIEPGYDLLRIIMAAKDTLKKNKGYGVSQVFCVMNQDDEAVKYRPNMRYIQNNSHAIGSRIVFSDMKGGHELLTNSKSNVPYILQHTEEFLNG